MSLIYYGVIIVNKIVFSKQMSKKKSKNIPLVITEEWKARVRDLKRRLPRQYKHLLAKLYPTYDSIVGAEKIRNFIDLRRKDEVLFERLEEVVKKSMGEKESLQNETD